MAAPTGDRILPYTYVLLRLPSGVPRVLRIVPDTTISLGKFGSFPANSLIHRPYNLTFDVLDPPAVGLRVVSAEEVTRDILGGGEGDPEAEGVGHYDLEYSPATPGAEGESAKEDEVMKSNRETVDDPLSQKMTWDEIEGLKKQGTGSGRDLIQRLLASHTAIHQKTTFALQKYTLRKTRKFLRRFTVFRLDVPALTNYLLEAKEPPKILELKNEVMALMLSLANIRWGGRYLVVDETGGLLVAAVAERLGLLDYVPEDSKVAEDAEEEEIVAAEGTDEKKKLKRRRYPDRPQPNSNTITLIHPNEQPNLSLLKYFNYDYNTPDPEHPIHTHLRTINWLQIVAPELDPSLEKPEELPQEQLQAMKSGKRTAYWRKMRRWEKAVATVEDTHKGEFDCVIVAAFMDVESIMKWAVPLVRGSGQVVAYAPSQEPLVELADKYSSANKAKWIMKRNKNSEEEEKEEEEKEEEDEEDEDKLDPTFLLAPTVHVTRERKYQVLPGRTHPVMTSRGGGEGFVFQATRVIPVEGRIEARGRFRGQKKKKDVDSEEKQLDEANVGTETTLGKRCREGADEIEQVEEVLEGSPPKKAHHAG
ncbi:tRNA (adenine(58)-N(1))-methyltransferase non-catalytic subunit trm6 [Rhizina undulata]